MVRRFGIIILALALASVFISGCQKSVRPKPPEKNEVRQEKKTGLPPKSESISGIVKAIQGNMIVVDVKGREIKILVDDKTTYQKGNEPGVGVLLGIRPETKIDVLVKNSKAIAIHYKDGKNVTKD